MLNWVQSTDRQTTNMLKVAARGPSENSRRINGDGLIVIGIRPRSQTLVCFSVSIDLRIGANFGEEFLRGYSQHEDAFCTRKTAAYTISNVRTQLPHT